MCDLRPGESTASLACSLPPLLIAVRDRSSRRTFKGSLNDVFIAVSFEMSVVSIAGIMLVTTVVGRVVFLYLESRAKDRRRMRCSG